MPVAYEQPSHLHQLDDEQWDILSFQNALYVQNPSRLRTLYVSISDIKEFQRHVNSCLDKAAHVSDDEVEIVTNGADMAAKSEAEMYANEVTVIKKDEDGSCDSEIIIKGTELVTPPAKRPRVQDEKSFIGKFSGHSPPSETPEKKGRSAHARVPLYKWIPDLHITVDAFKYGQIAGCNAYFLSHAHSDHYQRLDSKWNAGPIFASKTTSNIIKHKLKVPEEYVHVLPMDKRVFVQEANSYVTLLDANHCPGAVVFIFEHAHKPDAYVHCGDFRAAPFHVARVKEQLTANNKTLKSCYLDTTYLNPTYVFPPQEQVTAAAADLVKWLENHANKLISRDDIEGARLNVNRTPRQTNTLHRWFGGGLPKPKVHPIEHFFAKNELPADEDVSRSWLIAVGTYSIGKEKVAKKIALHLGLKIYCSPHKMEMLRLQDDPELHALLSDDPSKAAVHLVDMWHVNTRALSAYLKKFPVFTNIVGFKPTGWTAPRVKGASRTTESSDTLNWETFLDSASKFDFRHTHLNATRDSTGTCMCYELPYSEHSSFYELACFALSLPGGSMIATVNVESEAGRAANRGWFSSWSRFKARRPEFQVPCRSNDVF